MKIVINDLAEYYKKNKEDIKAKVQSYKEDNREYYRQLSREYRASEHGKRKHRIYSKNRNSKKHNITQTEWDACRLYFDYRCAYCGMTYEDHFKRFKKDLHREHVVFDGRNDLKNCVPSCHLCNRSKDTRPFNDWYKNHEHYTRERYLKIYHWMRFDCFKYIEKKKKKRK